MQRFHKILLFSITTIIGVGFTFLPTIASAATRTISATGGNWNSTTTWTELAVPTSADNVVATATSGNMTINVAASARSVDLTGYTGTLTHDAAITLSIGDGTAGTGNNALVFPSSGWTYTLGDAATSAISFVSTSTTQQTVNFGGQTIGNITFNGPGGSWILAGDTTFNNDLTITKGTLTSASSGTINIQDDFTNADIFTHNNGTVIFNGTPQQDINATSTTFKNLTLDNDSGNFDILSSFTVAGNFVNDAAGSILDPASAYTITAQGNVTISGAGVTGNGGTNLTINMTGTSKTFSMSAGEFATLLTLSGSGTTFTQTGGTFSSGSVVTVAGTTHTVTASTAVTVYGLTINSGNTFAAGSNALTINGTFSNSGTVTGSGTWDIFDVVNQTGATISATSGTFNIRDDFTNNGTFTHNNGTVIFNGTPQQDINAPSTTFKNLTLDNDSGNFDILSSFTVAGNFVNDAAGSILDPASAYTITVQGNVTLSGAGVTGNGGTNLTIDMTGGGAFAMSAGEYATKLKFSTGFSTYTFNQTGGSFSIASTVETAGGSWVKSLTAVVIDKLTLGNAADVWITDGFSITTNDDLSNTGTLRLNGTETTVSFFNTMDIDSGTVEYVGTNNSATNTYNIRDFGATDYYHLKIHAYHNTDYYASPDNMSDIMQQTSAIVVAGNLNNRSGIMSLNGNNVTVTGTFSNDDDNSVLGAIFRLQGSETVSLTMDTTSGTVEYKGDGDGLADSFTVKEFGSTDYAYLEIDSTDSNDTFVLGANTKEATLTIVGGTFDVTASNYSVEVTGSWYNSGTFTARSGTVTISLNGSGSPTITSGGSSFYNLTIGPHSGTTTVTLQDALVATNNFTHTGSQTVNANGKAITVGGNWNNTGTYTANSNTVTLNGVDQTISGTTTFYKLTKQETTNDSTNKTLTFTSGTTQTITNTLTLDGLDSNDKLLIRASTTSAATIDFTGSSVFSTTGYLDVQYNTATDNSSGITLPLSPANSTDSGNNVGWFGTATFDQKHYRFYSDSSVPAGLNNAEPLAAEDTNYNVGLAVTFRLRIEIANTGTIAGSITRRLEFKEDSGAWTQITTSSNNIRLSNSSNFTDGDATTTRLTATGTFTAGQGKDTGSDASSISLTNAYYVEDEYSLILQAAAAGHAYSLRITNAGTALDTYTVTATINSPDNAAPTASSFNPATSSTIKTATPRIYYSLDEQGDCKASTTNASYSAMSGADCTGDGSTSGACLMPDLGSDGSKTIYFACRDVWSNEDTSGTTDSVTYTLSNSTGQAGSIIMKGLGKLKGIGIFR